jgi:hypothetical protein
MKRAHCNLFLVSLSRSILILCCFGLLSVQAQSIQYPTSKSDFTKRSELRIDPSTLALNIEVPLGNYPERGGTELPVTLYYSSKVHHIQYLQSGNPEYQNFRTWSTPSYSELMVSGWTSSLGVPTLGDQGAQFYDYSSGAVTTTCSPSCKIVRHVQIIMPDGSSHDLRHSVPLATWISGQPAPSLSGTYYAVDGSQMRYEYDTKLLYLADGSHFILGDYQTPTVFYDRNGNTQTYNPTSHVWTDNLGRVIASPLAGSIIPGDSTFQQLLLRREAKPLSILVS